MFGALNNTIPRISANGSRLTKGSRLTDALGYNAAMAGNEEIFRRVREAVDIVDVIAEHIVLKKAGREILFSTAGSD